VVVCSTRLRISRAVAIGKVLLQLMDARTFVRNHDGIKTGYTKDVPLSDPPAAALHPQRRHPDLAPSAYKDATTNYTFRFEAWQHKYRLKKTSEINRL
jgi:hypothetical protein